MAYNILRLKQDLTGVIHGTTLNKVVNLNGIINRAARQVLQDIDPQETKRILPFATPIFESVYSYFLAPDVKGNAIIDIRPQVNRLASQVFNQDYNQQFSLSTISSLANQFTIQWNEGVRTILVNAPLLNTGVVVNYASSLNQNGTWSVGGNATNLTVNPVNFLAGGGALMFDLSADVPGSIGYLETSDMQAVNLSDFVNFATWFLYTFLPSASVFSSIELRFGSSPTDYYVVSTTQTQANTIFETGWNLLSYLWSNAVQTGSVNASSITYLRVTWTYNGTPQTGVMVNDIASRLGQIMEYEYYSKYMFRDAITGAFQETVTDDSNGINLDTDSYNILFNQVSYLTAQQLQGLDAGFFDANFFLQNYTQEVERYKGLYKSEKQKPRQPYYGLPKPGYSAFLPRRWNQ